VEAKRDAKKSKDTGTHAAAKAAAARTDKAAKPGKGAKAAATKAVVESPPGLGASKRSAEVVESTCKKPGGPHSELEALARQALPNGVVLQPVAGVRVLRSEQRGKVLWQVKAGKRALAQTTLGTFGPGAEKVAAILATLAAEGHSKAHLQEAKQAVLRA
jgi:hypothetical protein